MFKILNRKKLSLFIVVFIAITFIILCSINLIAASSKSNGNFIKYAEFNISYEALEKAMNEDISSQKENIKINWIDILSLLGTKYGGDFKKYKPSDIDSICSELKAGNQIDKLILNKKLFKYYNEVYSAVLCEFIGNYKTYENNQWVEKYGLKVFSPIAKTFPFCHFDDFGVSRSYGFKRRHLGHDMMAAVGTPVIAVESGTIEAMGWNQYGGWRIGIRSFDKKRYYYYAHLRKGRPFHCDITEGKIVKAGDVIGYVGRTGYSTKEDVNNIDKDHLHFGMQLIFDESQKECDNEIWIDLYAITKLLEKNKSSVIRNNDTKEYYRKTEFLEENLN